MRAVFAFIFIFFDSLEIWHLVLELNLNLVDYFLALSQIFLELLGDLLLSFQLFDEFSLFKLIRTENPLILNFNFERIAIFLMMKILTQNFLKENVL